ncbi:hypothetical protein CHU32_15230 [Superficieibacter electus]|uniref:Uncharacterized protein n=1 Tax=Superficieibacter electus TaxID=2022662 RepID=A0A2P5GNN6_9ENTR|nr:hypothetical protein [Superficieibacter electus]POP44011.1 hypothetical protein CHU33_13540 [Superficieibacter electus]POP48183.1 hypothetical protein CHU32_15230 [Superficieibacter electus]
MSKKTTKKRPAVSPAPATPVAVVPPAFGYEDMLSELEAIVVDAEVRLADEEVIADGVALSRTGL